MRTKTTKIIEGTLRFVGMWDNPIILETTEGAVDIAPILYGFFEENNRKSARGVEKKDYFSVKLMDADKVIDYVREYVDGKLKHFGFQLELLDGGFGMTNTQLYLEYTLTSLTGRHVVLELTDDQITLRVDGFDDDVPTVFYTRGNSSTLVGNYKVDDVCKPETDDCCIFLTICGDGFSCEKFNGPLARQLLRRHTKGTMNATRVGGCKNGGRWESLLDNIKFLKKHE